MHPNRRSTDGRKWVEYCATIMGLLLSTGAILATVWAFGLKQLSPHIDSRIELKSKLIYEEMGKMKIDNAGIKDKQDMIFYMLLQHLSPGERVRAMSEYRLSNGQGGGK